MKDLTQCGVFQIGEDIAWEYAAPGIVRKVYGYNDQIMMVKMKFEKGAVGTLHQHHHTQVSYVESGEFELIIDNENRKLKQGDGYLVPSNIIHGLFCIEPGVLVEAFTPCREDFLK